MSFRYLLLVSTLLLTATLPLAYGDGFTISGTCAANCNETFTDPNNPKDTASIDVNVQPGGTSGFLETSVEGQYLFYQPSIFFTDTITVPQSIPYIDVYYSSNGFDDGCPDNECVPVLHISGLGNILQVSQEYGYTVYTVANPGEYTISAEISGDVLGETESLGFAAGFEPSSFTTPEPGAGTLVLTGFLGIFGVFGFRASKSLGAPALPD